MKTLFIDSKSERTTDLLCKAMLSQINQNGIFSCGQHGYRAEKRLEGIQDDFEFKHLQGQGDSVEDPFLQSLQQVITGKAPVELALMYCFQTMFFKQDGATFIVEIPFQKDS